MDMKTLATVLLAVGGSTVAGVIGGILFRNIPHRLNDIVLGFAAGVMLAASVLGLIEPALSEPGTGMFLALAGVLAGAGLISVLDRIVPHLHRIAGIDTEPRRTGGTAGKTLLFVSAIALHKIPEGIATGLSFATEDAGDILTVAGSMSIQNVPEAMVIVAPLFAIGVATGRVVCISFGIAAVSMLSVVAGCVLASVSAGLTPFLLGAAGGAVLYVVSDEMIPETHSHGYEKPATFALIAGLVLVITLQRLAGRFAGP